MSAYDKKGNLLKISVGEYKDTRIEAMTGLATNPCLLIGKIPFCLAWMKKLLHTTNCKDSFRARGLPLNGPAPIPSKWVSQ